MINITINIIESEMQCNILYVTYDVVSKWVLGHLENNSHLKAGYKLHKIEHISESKGV
jgi:hypothetical protein